jgi:NADH dehydrogenase
MADDSSPAAREKDQAPRIVIIGGGFAGATAAQALERRLRSADIHLLSAENHLTYNPLLPEVVGASVLPGHVVAPLRQMVRRAKVHQVQVTGIDVDARRVQFRNRVESGCLDYDHLVLACGSRANLQMIPGMAEHTLPLKTVGDALFLRNRVIARLEDAELTRIRLKEGATRAGPERHATSLERIRSMRSEHPIETDVEDSDASRTAIDLGCTEHR